MNRRSAPPAVRVGSSAAGVPSCASGRRSVPGVGDPSGAWAGTDRPDATRAAQARHTAIPIRALETPLSSLFIPRPPSPAPTEGRKRYLAPNTPSSAPDLLSLAGDEWLQAAFDGAPHLLRKAQPLQLARLVPDRVDEGRHGALGHVADDAPPHRQADVLR